MFSSTIMRGHDEGQDLPKVFSAYSDIRSSAESLGRWQMQMRTLDVMIAVCHCRCRLHQSPLPGAAAAALSAWTRAGRPGG